MSVSVSRHSVRADRLRPVTSPDDLPGTHDAVGRLPAGPCPEWTARPGQSPSDVAGGAFEALGHLRARP